MNWQTNSAVIALRNLARRAGLTSILGNLMSDRGYESAFDERLFANLKTGDVVWDVGANVGYYTQRFADVVGPSGKVFAFEPFPATADRLSEVVRDKGNCVLHSIALGSQRGMVSMQIGGDTLGATNRIVAVGSMDGVQIEIRSGDDVVAEGLAECPTVVKIDTEGV